MPQLLPTDLHSMVRARANELGTVDFLARRKNQRLREMWCAAMSGLGYEQNFGPCEIDIGFEDEQKDYDFLLILQGQAPLPFQVTEALDPDRRRQQEYLSLGKDAVDAQIDALPNLGSGYSAQRLHEVVSAKAAKRYAGASNLHLLVYLNIRAGQVTWTALSSAVEESARSFASVWVVTDRLLACVYGGRQWVGALHWRQIAGVA